MITKLFLQICLHLCNTHRVALSHTSYLIFSVRYLISNISYSIWYSIYHILYFIYHISYHENIFPVEISVIINKYLQK